MRVDKTERLIFSKYNDIYGKLLPARQSEILRLYYDEDLSLVEIGEQFSMTRQGVSEAVKAAEKELLRLENALSLVKDGIK